MTSFLKHGLIKAMTKFIKLTKTSGSPIVLNIGDITTVSEAANQFGAEPSSQITLGGSVNKNYLHVKESMEQIETLIA